MADHKHSGSEGTFFVWGVILQDLVIIRTNNFSVEVPQGKSPPCLVLFPFALWKWGYKALSFHVIPEDCHQRVM